MVVNLAQVELKLDTPVARASGGNRCQMFNDCAAVTRWIGGGQHWVREKVVDPTVAPRSLKNGTLWILEGPTDKQRHSRCVLGRSQTFHLIPLRLRYDQDVCTVLLLLLLLNVHRRRPSCNPKHQFTSKLPRFTDEVFLWGGGSGLANVQWVRFRTAQTFLLFKSIVAICVSVDEQSEYLILKGKSPRNSEEHGAAAEQPRMGN